LALDITPVKAFLHFKVTDWGEDKDMGDRREYIMDDAIRFSHNTKTALLEIRETYRLIIKEVSRW